MAAGFGGAVVAGELADLFDGDATHLGRTLGRPLQGAVTQLLPAQGVLGDVIVVEPVVGDQLVHQRQRQGGVGAGAQCDVFVALVGGFALARVYAHQLGTIALGLLGVAPEVQVAANRVAAPDEDELGLGKELYPMPTLPPSVCTSAFATGAAQMVRSSSEAPRRWKKRRSMLSPCTRPMVPA